VYRIVSRFGQFAAVRYPLTPIAAGDSLWAKIKALDELRLDPGDPIGPRAYSVGSRLFLHPKYDRRSATDTMLYLIDYYALAPAVAADTDTVRIDVKYRAALLDKACELCSNVRQDWLVAQKWFQSYEIKVGRAGIREPMLIEKERQ
jgi:hypothetical protein